MHAYIERPNHRGRVTHQCLVVPRNQVAVCVSASRSHVVARIIRSAQAVPPDATAVPFLAGLSPGDARRALNAAHLRLGAQLPASRRRGRCRIDAQHPRPATVAPSDSEVRVHEQCARVYGG
jgi:hypothetical protein